jgi:hypothetical protein
MPPFSAMLRINTRPRVPNVRQEQEVAARDSRRPRVRHTAPTADHQRRCGDPDERQPQVDRLNRVDNREPTNPGGRAIERLIDSPGQVTIETAARLMVSFDGASFQAATAAARDRGGGRTRPTDAAVPTQDGGWLHQEEGVGGQLATERGQDHAIGFPPARSSGGASKDEPRSLATGYCGDDGCHTVRNATTGASRAARRAGYRPATTPSTSAEARPPHTATGGTTTVQ